MNAISAADIRNFADMIKPIHPGKKMERDRSDKGDDFDMSRQRGHPANTRDPRWRGWRAEHTGCINEVCH